MFDTEDTERFIVLDNIIYTCKLFLNSYNTPRLYEFVIDIHTVEILHSYIDVKYSLYSDNAGSSVYLGALIEFVKVIDAFYDKLKEDFIHKNVNSTTYIQYLYQHFYKKFKTIFIHDLDESDLWE